jgi:hypothetical protein
MFFVTLLLWSAFFVASQLLTPNPAVEDARPSTLDDFNFPTATEGRVISLVWGTDKINGPNVIWYGDLRVVPITEKVKVSLFKSKTYVTGHKYYVGFQMGIAAGECALRKIWVGDDLVWSGNQTTDGDITINSTYAKGTFSFYTGSKTQAVDPYLSLHQSPCPAYRGLSYGVFKGGYVGETTSIKSWSFEVTRITNGLSLTSNRHIVNTYDSNPMNVAYEIMTNPDWGYGYADADIDLTTLVSNGNTLYDEGNGMSMTLAQAQQAGDILEEIERQCDCNFRLSTTTGKFTCTLIRDGYSTSGLKRADNSTILELQEFSRTAWEGTVNHVRIQYTRRANDYTEGYAPAQDMANMQTQNRKISSIVSLPGVRDDTLANSIAWRELRANSYPLAKARFKVNRTFWDSYVGEVINFTYTCGDLSVEDMYMRVIKVDVGNPEAPEIVIDVVQDVFTQKAPSFADSAASSWTAPSQALIGVDADEQLAFEAPYAISSRDDYPAENRLWVGARSQGRREDGFNLVSRQGVTDPSTGTFYNSGNLTGFMQIGTLQSAIGPNTTTINIMTDVGIAELMAITDNTLLGEELTNMILIEDEFVTSGNISTISGGLTYGSAKRGLCDSAERAHAAGAKVWFICTGGVLTDQAYTPGYYVDLRVLPYRLADATSVSESDPGVTEIEVKTNYRERRPYPPTYLRVNATAWPSSSQSLDYGSGVDGKGLVSLYNRRDYRILDELSQLTVDASTLVGDFPSHNSNEYRLKLYKDPAGTMTLLYTGAWSNTNTLTVTRTQILAANAGVIPSTVRLEIEARHTDDITAAVRESTQTCYHDFPVDSAELSADNNWGVVSVSDTYTANWTAPDTGSYAFTLGTSGPSIWASVNDGAEQEIISAGNTTGSLTGVSASDTIKVKYKGSVAGSQTCVIVGSPASTEDAYVIFK